MNARAQAVALLLAATLAGCGRKSEPKAAAAPPDAGATPWQRGVVSFAGGHGHWSPCDSGAGGLLVDPTGILRRAVTQVGGPTAAAYAEITTIEGDAPDSARGPGRRHAWMVTAINRIVPDAEGGCDRAAGTFRFHAAGNEPFWAVEVTAESLIFMQPDAPSRLAWPVPAPLEHEGGYAWGCAADAEHPALRLELTQTPCADGMSGAWNAWSAVATIGARTLNGCAYEGVAPSGAAGAQAATITGGAP